MNRTVSRWVVMFVAVLLLGITLTPGGAATGDGGANTAQILRHGVGSIGPAMGDAQTGAAMGSTALHYNPAGLVHTKRSTSLIGFQSLVEDVDEGDLYFSTPMSNQAYQGNLTSNWYDPTIGYGLKYVSYGEEDETTVNVSGGDVTANDRGTFSGSDIVGTIGLASRIPGNMSLGLSGKAMRFEIAGVTATGFAVDAGLQHWVPGYGFSQGFTIKNIGPDITFQEAEEDLPAVARYGIGFKPFNNLMVTVDAEREIHRESIGFMAGANYQFTDNFGIQAGYDDRVDLDDGFTGGMTFKTEQYEVGYNYQPFGDFGTQHKFTVSYEWGASTQDGFKRRRPEPEPEAETIIEEDTSAETVEDTTAKDVKSDTESDQMAASSEPEDTGVAISDSTEGETYVSESYCQKNFPNYQAKKDRANTEPVEYTVQQDDNLWKISGCRLKVTWAVESDDVYIRSGLPPELLPDRLIALYWEDVIETNVDDLRSGNPDLIYPGETLMLPQVSDKIASELMLLQGSPRSAKREDDASSGLDS